MKLIENATVEFKREHTDEIKKTIIAFANTSGGTLYIGINDDGTAMGVEDVDATVLKLTNTIRDSIKPDLLMFVHIEPILMDEKWIVKVIVQQGTSCPYYLSGKGIRPEGVYIRHGASSVPATESRIIKMIKETDGEKYESVRSLRQELSFEEVATFFKNRGIAFNENQHKTLKLVNSDGLYTNLAMLLSDQCVHSIKVAVFQGIDKSVFKDRKEITGSLLKQLAEAYDYLDQHNGIKAEIAGLYRNERRDYSTEAIREALLNAIVHRDYSYGGSTMINLFDDHIEFISIGGLVKGMSFEDIMLGLSIARNENLANIFYRLNLVEAYGTGIPKIIKAYEGHVKQPELLTSNNAFKIILPNMNFESQGEAYIGIEADVLKMLSKGDPMSRSELQSALGCSQSTIQRTLKMLIETKAIRSIGRGKNTAYVL